MYGVTKLEISSLQASHYPLAAPTTFIHGTQQYGCLDRGRLGCELLCILHALKHRHLKRKTRLLDSDQGASCVCNMAFLHVPLL